MLAAVLLCAASAVPPVQDLEAALTASPAEAAIGEPVEWTLTVHHDRDDSLRLLQPELAPDASWVQVAGPRTARERSGDRAWTTVRWTLLSLEPGARELPVPTFELSSRAAVTSTPGHLLVHGELQPDEDAPRGFADLHEAPVKSGGWRPLVAVGLGLWLVCSALTAVLLVRGRRPEDETIAPAADALRALGGPAPGEQRAWMFRFSTLLRAACDETANRSRAGLTDEEWIAACEAEATLEDDVRADVRAVLGRTAEARYGGLLLTSFAVEELRESAIRVLGRLEHERATRRAREDPEDSDEDHDDRHADHEVPGARHEEPDDSIELDDDGGSV